MFKITLGLDREFSVIGIANVAKGTSKFQGLVNGIPFTQSADYQKVRARVLRAVEINQPDRSLS